MSAASVKPITQEQLLQVHEHDIIIAQPGESINISARDTRRKVNEYMGGEISMMMGGTEPALVYSQGRLVWRVPIEFTSPMRGHIGFVGILDVDARTSDLLIPLDFAKEIEANARTLLESFTHPAEV